MCALIADSFRHDRGASPWQFLWQRLTDRGINNGCSSSPLSIEWTQKPQSTATSYYFGRFYYRTMNELNRYSIDQAINVLRQEIDQVDDTIGNVRAELAATQRQNIAQFNRINSLVDEVNMWQSRYQDQLHVQNVLRVKLQFRINQLKNARGFNAGGSNAVQGGNEEANDNNQPEQVMEEDMFIGGDESEEGEVGASDFSTGVSNDSSGSSSNGSNGSGNKKKKRKRASSTYPLSPQALSNQVATFLLPKWPKSIRMSYG